MATPILEFDRKLFTLKSSQISRRMLNKAAFSTLRAGHASRTNGAPLLVNIVEGELLLLSEWVADVDIAAREVWGIQGQALTKAFLNDILQPEVELLVEVRKVSIDSAIAVAAARMQDATTLDAARGLLRMGVNQLKADVNCRYEIEARTLEHHQIVESGSNKDHQFLATASSKAQLRILVGKNISQLRKDCGWSMDELASRSGIDKKAILAHEHGRSHPRVSTLKLYALTFSKGLGRTITVNKLEE